MTLFIELRKHAKLADKRHPMFEKNRFGKYAMYAMTIFWAAYLIFFGITFAFAFDTNSMEPYHVLNSGLIIVLALDFLFRFPMQKTPTQEVKPYLLLPVRRSKVIDFLLIRSGLSGYNLFWLLLFVPFAIITLPKFFGIAGVMAYCIGIWLLMVFNNYWFLLCRTLFNERIWWLLLPIAVYGGIAAGVLIPDKSPVSTFFINLGEGYIEGNPFALIGTLAAIALMWFINRKLMTGLIYNELNKVEDTKVNASEYKFFERYGEMGEYMRLELKMLLRNKACKTSLRSVCMVTIAFSLLLSFTDFYDTNAMKSFITVYNYAIFGILFLLQVMGYEGNYIDGLMSRKESIYTLLRAKYIIYSTAILIPFVLSIPAMIMGKIEVLTSIGWAFFTIGVIYFCLFQLAVYNVTTIPLNAKIIGRQNTGSALQNLISMATLGIPLILYMGLSYFLDETTTAWILLSLGLSFTLTSRFWLKNIYNRLMKRRYKNMEGFRNSREKY